MTDRRAALIVGVAFEVVGGLAVLALWYALQ